MSLMADFNDRFYDDRSASIWNDFLDTLHNISLINESFYWEHSVIIDDDESDYDFNEYANSDR